MRAPLAHALDAVRRPEYTGENRCLPCTVINVALAVAGAVVLTAVVPIDGPAAVAVGGTALVGSAIVIYLRGYLVPGTPQVTRTYLPDRILRHFEHSRRPSTAADIDPAAVLEAAGAVTACTDVDDLCLTDAFRTAWYDRIDALLEADTSRADLAAVLDVPADALSFETHDSAFVALADGGRLETDGPAGRRRVGQWESRSAFLADVAGASVIDERLADWDRLAPRQRGRVLNGLRLFLDRCPSCGGPVAFGERTVESCCRSKDVVAVTCQDCGERLFEAEQPQTA